MLEHKTRIDEFVDDHPDLVGFLIIHGLPCVVCGEPFWGTLEELAKQKGWDDERIDSLVQEYNELQK